MLDSIPVEVRCRVGRTPAAVLAGGAYGTVGCVLRLGAWGRGCVYTAVQLPSREEVLYSTRLVRAAFSAAGT